MEAEGRLRSDSLMNILQDMDFLLPTQQLSAIREKQLEARVNDF